MTKASALSFAAPGLDGVSGVCLFGLPSKADAGVGAGISSHSSPEIFSRFKKKGQRFASITSDSLASAEEIITGDDFTIALATSNIGIARRLRVGVPADDEGGVEKSLQVRVVQVSIRSY